MAEKQTKTYRQLSQELEAIVDWFESDDIDLDSAISNYEQAAKLISQMQKHLKTAENKIKKITAAL